MSVLELQIKYFNLSACKEKKKLCGGGGRGLEKDVSVSSMLFSVGQKPSS